MQLSYRATAAHAQPYRTPAPSAAAVAAAAAAAGERAGVPMAAPPVLGALAVLLQSTTLPSVKLAAPAALLQLGAQKHQATLPAPSSGRCDWNFRCAFALQVPPGPAPGLTGRARPRQAVPAGRRLRRGPWNHRDMAGAPSRTLPLERPAICAALLRSPPCGMKLRSGKGVQTDMHSGAWQQERGARTSKCDLPLLIDLMASSNKNESHERAGAWLTSSGALPTSSGALLTSAADKRRARG